MAEDKAKRNPKVEEKSIPRRILDSFKYSGAGDKLRKEEIDRQTGDDPASSVPTTPEPQSRSQYMHERDAGDPVALSMSFDQWKKLG